MPQIDRWQWVSEFYACVLGCDQKEALGPGKMAYSTKHLSKKHGDLTSSPGAQVKHMGVMVCTGIIPSRGGGDCSHGEHLTPWLDFHHNFEAPGSQPSLAAVQVCPSGHRHSGRCV